MPSDEIQHPKGTVPQGRARTQTPQEKASLNIGERKKLFNLGYAKEHVGEMSVDQARQVIAAKTYRPGSDAYLRNTPNPLTGVPDATSASLSDEAIQAKQQNGTIAKSNVIVSEYTGRLIKGEDPLDALLIQYAEANPGKRFRLINPDLPTVAGPQWDPVSDDKGKLVTEGGLILSWMPEEVYEQAYVRPNLEKSSRLMQKVKSATRDELADGGVRRDADDETAGAGTEQERDQYAPVKRDSLEVRRSDTVYAS